jgi:hypothetical protein
MTRLVAFGCSNTLGESLSGCHSHRDPARNKASDQAWPSFLAKLWNCSVLNLGHAGASNKFIARRALEFDFHREDCVVILWSSFERSCVFKRCRDVDYQQLLPLDLARYNPNAAADKKATKFYYKLLHSSRDSCFNSFVLINCVKQYLDSIGIANHHFSWWWPDHVPAWNQVPLTLIDLEQLPVAGDGLHPSREGHYEIGNEIYNAVFA